MKRILLSQLVLTLCCLAQDIPVPIELAPSGSWDGNDGPWSTFTIAVGSPPQAVRVVPSLAQNIVTVVRPNDCMEALYGFQNCTEERGGVFDAAKSETWTNNGDHIVDPLGNGLFNRTLTFGTDTVGLGIKPLASKMKNQTVGLMHAFSSSYIGIVGISPVPVNYTEDNRITMTFFEALQATTRIAGKTVAYTAGSFNRKLLGSLILGGYDFSRIATPGIQQFSINMTNTRLRELTVGIKELTITDSSKSGSPTNIVETPFSIPIEPLISRMWLPPALCDGLERSLGLKWNDSARLYYITDQQHEDFLSRNITFTFTLSDPSFNGPTTKIQFPYDVLALNAIYPLTDKPGRYLPIQRGVMSDGIVLGRAFLQAAYLIADYDRQTLNITQANLNEITESWIRTIIPPSNNSNTPMEFDPLENKLKTRKLTASTIAGIVIVAIALVIGAIGLVFILRRRRRKIKGIQEEQLNSPTHELADQESGPRAELEASNNMLLEKDDAKRIEMDGTGTPAELSPIPLTSELAGDSPVQELDGSPVGKTYKWPKIKEKGDEKKKMEIPEFVENSDDQKEEVHKTADHGEKS